MYISITAMTTVFYEYQPLYPFLLLDTGGQAPVPSTVFGTVEKNVGF